MVVVIVFGSCLIFDVFLLDGMHPLARKCSGLAESDRIIDRENRTHISFLTKESEAVDPGGASDPLRGFHACLLSPWSEALGAAAHDQRLRQPT